MGAMQAPLFPTSSVFLARWMPKAKEGEAVVKAWATSMLDVGISLGTLFTIPAVTFLVEAFGWRYTYYIIGLNSAAFVGLWIVISSNSPSECWFISKEEREYLEANVSKPKAKTGKEKGGNGGECHSTLFSTVVGMPWEVAIDSGVWAVFVAHMAFNFGNYYFTNWSPSYYKDVLGVDPKDAYIHLMLPHVTNLVVKSLNPYVSGVLVRRGYDLLACRKFFTCTGLATAALCLLSANSFAGSVWMSTVAFSLAHAGFGLAPNGFRSWPLVLATVCAGNILAVAVYSVHVTVSPVEQKVATKKDSSTIPTLLRSGLRRFMLKPDGKAKHL
jgi:sugar phosphate permease